MSTAPILVASAEPAFRNLLSEALEGRHEMVFEEDHRQARAYLERRRPLAFLTCPCDRLPADEDALRTACRLHPNLPVALISNTSEVRSFFFLKQYGIGAAIPPETQVSPAHLRVFFQHLIAPESLFSFEDYLPEKKPLSKEQITTPDMRLRILELLTKDFENCPHVNLHDLQLVFEEILNNAIMHAFRTEQDHPKYTGREEEPFDTQDEIVLEWCVGKESSVIAVTDNQGLLSRRRIWDRFIRQISLTGLLDTSGRGLFLTHLLSQLVLISVIPGKNTRVAVFFGASSTKHPKPISIQVVAGA